MENNGLPTDVGFPTITLPAIFINRTVNGTQMTPNALFYDQTSKYIQ